MKLTEKIVKEIFNASGYEFTKKDFTSRLLFYNVDQDANVQFFFDKDTTIETVMTFIRQREYYKGKNDGMHMVQNEIKKILNL